MIAYLSFGRPRSIQFWLRLVAISCLVPVLILTAILVARSYQRERSNTEVRTIGAARALMQVVDQQLANAKVALTALATSPYLTAGDLDGFQRQAMEVLPSLPGNAIVLVDPSGQQLINTFVPFGEPLPHTGSPELLREVVESAEPRISDLFIGSATRQPQVAVGVPVIRNGKILYVITTGIQSSSLTEILKNRVLPQDWAVAILDRSGIVVARTIGYEQSIGRPTTTELWQAIGKNREGAIERISRERVPIVAVFSQSDISGFSIAIGIPQNVLNATLRQDLWIVFFSGIAVLLVALWLSRYISLQIGRSISSLTTHSVAETGASVGARITEVDAALEALRRNNLEREEAERAAREMAVAAQVAEGANHAKSRFLSLMSHELRTPLNGILGFTQLLTIDKFGPLNDKQREYVKIVLDCGHHLLSLVNDVLDLSMVESDRISLSIERVAVVPLMKSVMATLEGQANNADITLFASEFGLGRPDVRADRTRLAQALLNLGSNAIKYNRPGGEVRFSYRELANATLRFEVRDTGNGIPENRHAEVFQQFNRLGAERTMVEGTGIGLALTRRLVDLMGGTIGFSSTLGAGSCFWIDMPLHPGEAPDASLLAEPAPKVDRTGLVILYVEDSPASAAVMRHVISTLDGALLLEATDGASGLAMAQAHRPDLILLDINLPDRGGYTVLRQLRRRPDLAETPVLALSAAAMPHDIERGLEAGFFRYLTKPLELNLLFQAINDAAARRVPAAADALRPD